MLKEKTRYFLLSFLSNLRNSGKARVNMVAEKVRWVTYEMTEKINTWRGGSQASLARKGSYKYRKEES